MREIRLMSRKIVVVRSTGERESYTLSIANIKVDTEDNVKCVDVIPFLRETENVEYVDGEIEIIIGDKLRLQKM